MIMKKVIIFIIVIIQGCSLLKETPLSLNGSYYISDQGMSGNSTLSFIDSTFIYTESGGLFEGKGKWEFTPDGKFIILQCVISTKGGDMKLEQKRYFKLKIKGKKILDCDTDTFIRKK